MVVFFTVILSLIAVVHWYLWLRLVRDVSEPCTPWRRIGTALLVLLPLAVVASRVGDAFEAPFGLRQALAWPGYVWLVVLLYLVLSLLVGEALRPLLRCWLARRDARRAPAGDAPAAGADADAAGNASGTREHATVAAEGAAAGGAPAGTRAADGRGTADAGPVSLDKTAGDEGTGDDRPAGTGEDGCAERPGVSRRMFVARAVAIGATTVAVSTTGYGVWAARQLATKHVTVRLANLPAASEGYRITVVGDMHLSTTLGRSFCERVVAAVNATDTDAVAMVGDLVDATVPDLRHAAEPLGDLRARDGVFFVTGNHEYYVGATPWVEHVQRLGMISLANSRVELEAGFDIAGVNDIAADERGGGYEGPDFAKALDGRDPQRPVVVLAHQPELIHTAVDHDVDLVLSGHTHGGQVWPGPIIAARVNPTLAGLEQYGDSQLFVTRGAGTWGPPVRVGAEPDITVLTLARA
ncbi:metallophosphoesterase [Streptomyces spiramenti]|uniref:Metallophosphoesterase n=1 Tax=Streptomyces spiramenti TaxID=2720606 RepID=A0ABX1AL13_9ACTN|nr:metallophosphoesterase [Streptomyces spiramenti]NJP67793.1 metallophosphoesterase [Streptomyces spiramenti]